MRFIQAATRGCCISTVLTSNSRRLVEPGVKGRVLLLYAAAAVATLQVRHDSLTKVKAPSDVKRTKQNGWSLVTADVLLTLGLAAGEPVILKQNNLFCNTN